MSKLRAFSSPNLLPLANAEDLALEGVATNVLLLLKLIQEHNDGCNKSNDDRKPQRIAGMISILNDVKTKIEKVQVPAQKPKREKGLRRCNTDLRRSLVIPKEKKPQEPTQEENEKLRRELFATTAARKNLESMFSSLGKEKEIMASELARRVQELSGMEEHLNDLKEQNEMLLAKAHACAEEHNEKRAGGRDVQVSVALQERNKALSEQLLKSLDGYRALKRKFKDAQEENAAMKMKIGQVAEEVAAGLDRINGIRQRLGGRSDMPMDKIEEELAGVDSMFRCFQSKLLINGPKRGECVKPVGDVAAEKSPVLV